MRNEAGFSAVELLITLFIAAIFIATGYQLYTVVITSGAEANSQSIASGIAYENIRRYASQVPNPCAPATPSPAATIPANTLPNPSIDVVLDCPYGNGATVGRVMVTVRYGTPQQEVVHAMYVNN